ncbi:KR-domain-containing protein [Aspergillus homomorphus CBS 101889]|uniref:KR-domain-containing protein n=1 Tax=Aspergillus homomorphus (strain CBS 101889) TaxID=1450537 RepID=A0A395I6F8_ASPHC|nr:KR-domain-containing protein [Aspergillus homomorphus CBS 101889]RAL15720.1 KR-domain-containing protein [Aspergillus homomorphus CBS 101889]
MTQQGDLSVQSSELHQIVKDTVAGTVIEAQFSPPKPILSTWEDIQRPVRLISTSPGVDYLAWVTDEEILDRPLAANEIEIDVQAVGLNFKDLLVAMGEIDQPGFGHEAAGIAVGVGSSVRTFQAGDRVMYLGDPSPGKMGTLRTRSRTHPGLAIKIPDSMGFEICQDLLQETIQLWSNDEIQEARPTQVLGYGQLKEGLRLLQTGKSIGKITLVPGTHPVSVIPAPLLPLELDANASFILAGGLGGIGRGIALRLASRGAKHLIFLSRSAPVHEAGQETIAKLKLFGCKSHVFQCDISDEPRLREGNRSQANYNAGNNFQDALARHRVSKGMHSARVNLGAVVGIGFIAENVEYVGKHTFKMANSQTGDEVLAAVEYLSDRRNHTSTTTTTRRSRDTAQLVCGLRTPASYSLGNEDQPTHLRYPMFAQLSPALSKAGGGTGAGSATAPSAAHLRNHLKAATTAEDAARIIYKAVRRKVADLLNVAEDSFDDSLNVRANGVDSLIQMEFRTWFANAKELGTVVPLKDLAKDLTQLSARLVSLSSFSKFR